MGRNADGIILDHTVSHDARVQYLMDQNLPFVTFGQTERATEHAHSDLDNEFAAYQGTKSLLDQGYRRIALIDADTQYFFVGQRVKGYARALAEAGIAVDPTLVRHIDLDAAAARDAAPIRTRGLGWDITDYGQGKFDELGLFLFTTRNSTFADLNTGRGMLYAEKVMITRQNQLSPMHRHNIKAEDIINGGGGELIIELFAPNDDGTIDHDSDVTVPSDGQNLTLPAGGLLRLKPGQNVTLMPGIWHAFWAEKGDCLVREVSTVNDDRTDNVFEMNIGRFSSIVEDSDPLRLLVSYYV